MPLSSRVARSFPALSRNGVTMKYSKRTFGQAEAIFNILGGESAIDGILRGELIVTVTPKVVVPVPPPPPPLLTLVGHIELEGTILPFIDWLGDNFSDHFVCKIESIQAGATLTRHTLNRASLDEPIRKELTPELEETTLSELYELLSRQSEGQAGILLTNGYANIFYIKDAKGNFWAVSAHCYVALGGWRVEASSVTFPLRWFAGCQVFSRPPANA